MLEKKVNSIKEFIKNKFYLVNISSTKNLIFIKSLKENDLVMLKDFLLNSIFEEHVTFAFAPKRVFKEINITEYTLVISVSVEE